MKKKLKLLSIGSIQIKKLSKFGHCSEGVEGFWACPNCLEQFLGHALKAVASMPGMSVRPSVRPSVCLWNFFKIAQNQPKMSKISLNDQN